MTLKIRLRQQGRTNRVTYRLVLADSRSPRDGKYVEMLGWYCPCETKGNNLHIEAERVEFWLNQGAQLSEKAESLVKKGAPSVLKTYKERIEKRNAKLRDKRRASKKEVEDKASEVKKAAPVKSDAKKPAAKKTAEKKTVAKKPAAKKTAEKKKVEKKEV